MKIDVPEKGEVILSAKSDCLSGRQIAMYRLTFLDHALSDRHPEDYYVAVPEGKRVKVRDLPKGRYELKQLNGTTEAEQPDICYIPVV